MCQRGGHVRATVSSGTTAAEIQDRVRRSVETGSILCTDEHRAYLGLNSGYVHLSVNNSAKEFVNGMSHTNGIESVCALLKRAFYGIYHQFGEKHLQRYVSECA